MTNGTTPQPGTAGTSTEGDSGGGAGPPGGVVALLVVGIDDVPCGLRLADVIEVLPAAHVEPLPGAPRTVLGVINLRGDIVAVLDGRRCLGREEQALRPSDRFVVVQAGHRPRAIRVDRAERITDVAAVDIQSAEALATGVMRSTGVVRLDDGLILVVDPSLFLSDRDDQHLERLVEEAAHR